MKKFIALLSVAVLALAGAQRASAIEDPNPKGNLTLGAYVSVAPGANFTGDVVIANVWKGHITIGGVAGVFYAPQVFYPASIRNPEFDIFLAPRATFGLNLSKKIQVYAGLFTGVRVYFNHEYNPTYNSNPFLYTNVSPYTGAVKANFGFAGGMVNGFRFFLTDRFALSAEICPAYPTTLINMGVSLKF